MTAIDRLAPRFVEEVPERLAPGILYVSLEHASMMHLCACGCGHEVALPLTPLDWRLTYDGRDISLSPSVGSWSLPCRSHYVVDRGRIRWAGDMTDAQVKAGRRQDRNRRDRHHGVVEIAPDAPPTTPATPVTAPARVERRGWLERLRDRLLGTRDHRR